MQKLLIVDDEKIIRETIANLIDWESLDITLIGAAQNGIEAYNIILDEYPDIVLTDIKMPGLSGLDLIEKIHKVNQDTQFVILSGYGEFEYAKKAMKYGVKHYLLKPCNEEQIISCLQEVQKDFRKHMEMKRISKKTEVRSVISSNLMVSMITDALGSDSSEKEMAIEKHNKIYKKYVDTENLSFELYYVYYVLPECFQEIFSRICQYRQKNFPGISIHMLYVRGTLVFFFQSYGREPQRFSSFLNGLHAEGQDVKIEYKREFFSNLGLLMEELIHHIRRYEIIYYGEGENIIPIYNYGNVLKKVRRLTREIYDEDKEKGREALLSLMYALEDISDTDFLKQLVSTVIIHSVSQIPAFEMTAGTQFLLEIYRTSDSEEIMKRLNLCLQQMFEEYHAKPLGEISRKIMEYVEQHLGDSSLSLKWIAENYLYMNVDYLSKRFVKETGMKFSRYLTETRVRRAKDLLAFNKKTIQEAAEMVGCGNNPQYFGQIFKKATGMTPSQYMKTIHRKD